MDPLGYLLATQAPDLYAKQLGIQNRMALGNALLQGGADPGRGAYGGFRSAGNSILGAILMNRATKDMASLYSPDSAGVPQTDQQTVQAGAGLPTDENIAQTFAGRYGMTPNQVYSAAGQQQPAPNAQAMMGQQAPQVSNGTPAAQPQQARTIPQAFSQAIPTVPGWTPQQSQIAFLSSPQAYWTAMSPTPEFKNALSIAGGDPEMAKQIMLAQARKASVVNLRPGGGGLDFMSGNVFTMPNTNGVQTTFPLGMNGPAQMGMVPGAAPALAQSELAQKVPGAFIKPQQGFDAYGQPTFTNELAASGNANLADAYGLRTPAPPSQQPLIGGVNIPASTAVESGGNPYAVSPRGAVGPMQTMPGTLRQPGFGVSPAQGNAPQEQARVGGDYLNAMVQRYNGNPVLGHIAYNMGPSATDQWLASGGDFSRLPEETQKYLGRIAVAQAVPQSAQIRPGLPPGQQTYLEDIAKDAGNRHDANVAAAAESPMRINVLDNIINLSGSGVATGPTQDWQNRILGAAANVPGLSKLMGGAKDNVSKFQELQKFTYQNALRNWSAAGGTGTDKQMESFSHANPNDTLFPQALQAIAKWGKASEYAIQGKANAQDMFLGNNGNTPTNQIKFENMWRNNFDPKVYQYMLMSPQEKQAFARDVLRTPEAAKAFIAKQQRIAQMGGLPQGAQ